MDSPQKPLKVTLIYPPGEQKISEPIPPPNMTIAVLAGALIKNGHEVFQIDAEKDWFDRIQYLFSRKQLSLLYDKDSVGSYVNGKASKKLLAEYDRIGEMFLKGLDIKRSDLVGITLVDIRAEPLIINFSALMAYAVKKKFKAKTVIGYRGLPKEAFFYLMRRYPCFDYGVYAEWGEKALLEILKDAAGEKAGLVGTVARKGGKLRNYQGDGIRRPYAPRPHYEDHILEKYRVRDRELFASYNSNFPFIKKLIKNDKKYLVVPYAFELTCTGACAFCENNNKLPSDMKSADQIIDELSGLKEKGATGIYFVNSSFNNHYKFAEELCDRMIKYKLNLKWFDCANLRMMDERLLDKMKAAGAVKLTFGVETGSQRLLDYVKKGVTVEKARKYLEYSHKIGIWNHIELIAGFPTESPRDVEATVNSIDSIKDFVDIYTLNPFYLYPNSRFYREQEKFGVKVVPYPPMQFMNFFYPLYRIVEQYSLKFDEVGGLKWEEKNRQIIESTKAVAGKIDSIATFRAIGNEHLYLLMCLYDKLGHENKELIRKMVRILTLKFRPYNLNFFLGDFRTSFSKEKDLRIFLPIKTTSFLGKFRPPRVKHFARR
ncbi:MAG: radical SAM protein [Elusimicrobia bacterium]|nr:radical SAM protein [Elusimicrobiota bacterium]